MFHSTHVDGVVERAVCGVDVSEGHGSVDLVGVGLVKQRLVHLRRSGSDREARNQTTRETQKFTKLR